MNALVFLPDVSIIELNNPDPNAKKKTMYIMATIKAILEVSYNTGRLKLKV